MLPFKVKTQALSSSVLAVGGAHFWARKMVTEALNGNIANLSHFLNDIVLETFLKLQTASLIIKGEFAINSHS